MMQTTSTSAPSPARIFETLRQFQESAALKTAIDLGVFTAIAEGARSSAEIAQKCGASERGIRILCDTLAANEFLTKADERYSNSEDSALFLDRRSPAYMGGAAEFLCEPQLMIETFRTLTDCVRKGGTMLPGEGSVSPDNPVWVTFARAMGPLAAHTGQLVAQKLPDSGAIRVLDIAAGHGMFGIAIAKRNPEAQIVALDWAPVLETAKANAQSAGVQARYETRPGSAFDVEFGDGYDVVLLTNFLHHFDVETNETLLRKVHAALRPGGRAVTLEYVPEEDRISPRMPARFALTMLFTTERGDAYTFSELESMFRNAGFASSEHHRLETQQSVIISTK